MPPLPRNSRTRILEAATELAREMGPGNLSLDAVAHRAGLSKGGLLYNFPSKAKLMEALVEHHITQNRDALERARERFTDSPNRLALAIVEVFRQECGEKEPPGSGVLAAIAENPCFLDPIRCFQQQLVERLKAESDDSELALMVFLVIEGLRCLKLFEIDAVTRQEAEAILDRLSELVRTQSRPLSAP